MAERVMVVRDGQTQWRKRPTITKRRADAGTHRLSHYRRLNPPTITKEEAACCMSLVDDLGRPPIGFCDTWEGRDQATMPCLRRLERDARLGVR